MQLFLQNKENSSVGEGEYLKTPARGEIRICLHNHHYPIKEIYVHPVFSSPRGLFTVYCCNDPISPQRSLKFHPLWKLKQRQKSLGALSKSLKIAWDEGQVENYPLPVLCAWLSCPDLCCPVLRSTCSSCRWTHWDATSDTTSCRPDLVSTRPSWQRWEHTDTSVCLLTDDYMETRDTTQHTLLQCWSWKHVETFQELNRDFLRYPEAKSSCSVGGSQ